MQVIPQTIRSQQYSTILNLIETKLIITSLINIRYHLLIIWITLIFNNIFTAPIHLKWNIEGSLLFFSQKYLTVSIKYCKNRIANVIASHHSCYRMNCNYWQSCWSFLLIWMNCSKCQLLRSFNVEQLFLLLFL